MFEWFKKISTNTSAAELKVAKEKIDIAELETALRKAEADRAGLLLTGSNGEIQAAESRLTNSRIDLDRATAMQAELTRRIEEAEANEKRAALQAEIDAVNAEADACAKALRKDYARLANSLADILELLQRSDTAVAAMNTKLYGDGMTEPAHSPLTHAEERAWPLFAAHRGVGWNSHDDTALPQHASLRAAPGTRGFGRGRAYVERFAPAAFAKWAA
jgi:hypothetical protein